MTASAQQNTSGGPCRVCCHPHAGEGAGEFPGTLIRQIAAPSGDGSTGSAAKSDAQCLHCRPSMGVSSLNSPGLRAGGLFPVQFVTAGGLVEFEGYCDAGQAVALEQMRQEGSLETISFKGDMIEPGSEAHFFQPPAPLYLDRQVILCVLALSVFAAIVASILPW